MSRADIFVKLYYVTSAFAGIELHYTPADHSALRMAVIIFLLPNYSYLLSVPMFPPLLTTNTSVLLRT